MKEGGNWIRITWSLRPERLHRSRNSANSALQSRKRQACVIVRGSLQAKRKEAGVLPPNAARLRRRARCRRWSPLPPRESSASRIPASVPAASRPDKKCRATPRNSRRRCRAGFFAERSGSQGPSTLGIEGAQLKRCLPSCAIARGAHFLLPGGQLDDPGKINYPWRSRCPIVSTLLYCACFWPAASLSQCSVRRRWSFAPGRRRVTSAPAKKR